MDATKQHDTHNPERSSVTHFLSFSVPLTPVRGKHDTLTVQCVVPKHSKPIIDEIDRVLAKHYGFTDEELDFIVNYDIKYRMGREGGDSEEE